MARSRKRITKELQKITEEPIEGIRVVPNSENTLWTVTVTGAAGTLYAGETYNLRVTFGDNYPMESPEVIFLVPSPVHPHIYSNGHICLSILYNDWSPALTIANLCLSILSMMSSATIKERPRGNDSYVQSCRHGPKMTSWVFHDDDC